MDRMNQEQILLEIQNLRLPANQYVVVGGAALTARGIRETNDIDLVVTPELFDTLKKSGWSSKARPNGKPGLYQGCVEAYLDVDSEDYKRSIEELISNAEYIDRILFVDLNTLAGYKASYARPKDIDDLGLIREYMELRGRAEV